MEGNRYQWLPQAKGEWCSQIGRCHWRWWLILVACFAFGFLSWAGYFPGNAYVTVNDGAFSGMGTISCWFKISVPSSATLSENMTILVNRTDGGESNAYAYLIRYNVFTGNLEFSAQDASGTETTNLILRPFQERWYHLAVVRQNDAFTGYVDGHQVFSKSTSVGVGRVFSSF